MNENANSESSERIIRPSQAHEKQVSLMWQPGVAIVELAYAPDKGLHFLMHKSSDGGIAEGKNLESGHVPLAWVEPFARVGDIRLPSMAEDYGSVDVLAEQIRAFIRRYFDCDPIFESVAVLYILHTWLYERFQAVPYLRFLGDPETGKTRGTETIGALCYHPLIFAGAQTAAPLYRLIEDMGGTALIDEADFKDSQVGSDLMKILNCGYQKGLTVKRMNKDGAGRQVPVLFSPFGPKIVNGRQRFSDEAPETRCLTYTPTATLRRDIPVQLPDSFRKEVQQLQNHLLKFRFDVLDSLKPSSEYVAGVSRRMNQIILPLLTMCELLSPQARNRCRGELLQFARRSDHQKREIRSESIEAAIVRVLSGYGPKPPTCFEVAQAVIIAEQDNVPDLRRWFGPRKVGEIVRALGLETKHTEKGTVILLDGRKLRGLEARYGIERHKQATVSQSSAKASTQTPTTD